MCVEKNKKFSKQVSMYNVWYGRGKNKICYSHTKSDKIWPPDVMYTQEIKGRENLSTRLLRRAPAFFFSQKDSGKSITKPSPFHDAAYKGV